MDMMDDDSNGSMVLVAQISCTFIFKQLQSTNIFTFLLGSLISAFIAFITVGLPNYKNKFIQENIKTQQTNKPIQNIKKFTYYLLYSLMHIINMLLVMTMNITVILFIITGATLSYYLFFSQKKDKCCHS